MSTVRPTKKQRALLDYIEAFINEHGYSPSYREIMNGCGYSSIATVAVHIKNLIERGHLRKRDHSARSLELTGGQTGGAAGEASGGESGESGDGVRWLTGEIDNLLVRAESAGEDVADVLDKAQVLLASLRILGFEEVAQQFGPRLQEIRVRVNDDGTESEEYNQP